eukprot:CAMPEP_0202351190 /NCGR_PEP_ID=MMETSP1126-20121109/7943_1 /ASSEMBLY_ACC=CAM_ASM_000457 /TAXON_ID=3047 /ORGANISM="Dunaliella tertiolecta, Strain CCMP1320" /LENGTH=376 /DNA_ID=CAMNT_0048943275 /DNA_START=154 /DNA_END=1284 /DNA_ORIENTATION=-
METQVLETQQSLMLRPKRARRHSPQVLTGAMSVPAGTTDLNSGLAEYITKGPILARCGISPESVHTNLTSWVQLGEQLAKQLGFNHDNMDAVQKLRVYHYYLPVYFWCTQQLRLHKESGAKTALVVGISAPQGCGKSTLVEQLQALLISNGHNAANVSIDDFYLRFQDQSKLAAEHSSNPLLQYRGNAGTHDLELGAQTLQRLRDLHSPSDSASVPRYDKSANGGRGDRADPSTWPKVNGPVDIVLFEGWMSGFSPLPEEEVKKVDPSLVGVNAFLKAYRHVWDEMVDSWLVIQIGDPQWVFKWRLQAEEGMRASGKPGMSDDQIADFVARFMPAYKAYLPQLYSKGPTTARPNHTLIIEVDEQRSPMANQPQPVL